MTTPRDPRRRAERQRQRRMAQRVCGNCGERADAMVDWGGQAIAICQSCRDRLGSSQVFPESGYRWSQLQDQDQGPWCEVHESRPCEDCAFFGTDDRTDGPPGGSDKRPTLIDRLLGRQPR